jgi:hypothetical protein
LIWCSFFALICAATCYHSFPPNSLCYTEERVDLARYTLDGLEEDEREGLEARVLAGVVHVVGADRELEEFLRLAYHLGFSQTDGVANGVQKTVPTLGYTII